jgi:hypothetical protein
MVCPRRQTIFAQAIDQTPVARRHALRALAGHSP